MIYKYWYTGEHQPLIFGKEYPTDTIEVSNLYTAYTNAQLVVYLSRKLGEIGRRLIRFERAKVWEAKP